MALSRIFSPLIKQSLKGWHLNVVSSQSIMVCMTGARNLSSIEVTKNLTLLSKEKKNCKIINLKLERPEDKPMVVLLSWMMANKKHIYKYADIYLDQGFDVLNVYISPWQLLWPTKGTQVVAKDILKFLDANAAYAPLVLHGFSVGAYVWSEVIVKIAAERERYQHIIDRIVGQIWDSAADITEIPVGLPIAVFPRNAALRSALRQYVLYHMKTFDKVATCHYVRASQMFHTNIVRAPALILCSKTDPIGSKTSNERARDNWENIGMEVQWQCWDKSPHVGHFRAHPKEYRQALDKFMDTLQLPNNVSQQKIQAKL